MELFSSKPKTPLYFVQKIFFLYFTMELYRPKAKKYKNPSFFKKMSSFWNDY